MHLEACIFDAKSHQDQASTIFFAARSALAIAFRKSQNQPLAPNGSAGRNARGRWEEI